MPEVPSYGPPRLVDRPAVSQSALLMAAAVMHEQGRLFEDVFDPQGTTKAGQAALEHAEKNKVPENQVFEHGGESWVHGNGAIDRASEKQIIDSSTKALRSR